jgi:hypothetical protein
MPNTAARRRGRIHGQAADLQRGEDAAHRPDADAARQRQRSPGTKTERRMGRYRLAGGAKLVGPEPGLLRGDFRQVAVHPRDARVGLDRRQLDVQA